MHPMKDMLMSAVACVADAKPVASCSSLAAAVACSARSLTFCEPLRAVEDTTSTTTSSAVPIAICS